MYQKPIRTYERNPKPASVAITKTFVPCNFDMWSTSSDTEFTFHCKENDVADSNNSIDNTFDRICKTAKLPPLPVQPLDNTVFTSSSECFDESLKSISIKNPIFTNEINNHNQNKKDSSQKNTKKQLKASKKVRKKDHIQKVQNNDNTDNDNIEFSSLKRTRRVKNKQTSSENIIDKLSNKLNNFTKSGISKELKECCVTLTPINLNKKNLKNSQLSSVVEFNDQHDDNEKSFEIDKFEEKLVNSNECCVILSRLNTSLEQKQKRKKVLLKLESEKKSLNTLFNVDMSIINSSTPFDKRHMQKRSRPTLSPIINDVPTIVNNNLKTVLFDETKKLFFSDESSKNKELSITNKIKISKIKDNNHEALNETKNLNILSSSLHENTTKLISDGSDEIVLDTFANISNNNSSELAEFKIPKNYMEKEKKNSFISNYSSSSLFSEIENVEIDQTDEELIESKNSLNKNSRMNSENNFNSNSTASESNKNTIPERNLKIQNSTIFIDSQCEITTETSQVDKSKSSKNSDNDEDSIRLVLSSTSSDKNSIEYNSKKVLNDQDLFDNNSYKDNSNMNNDNLEMENISAENLVQPLVILTRLNNPLKITERRDAYKNWKRPLNVILENSNRNSLDSYTERLNSIITTNSNLEEMTTNNLDAFSEKRKDNDSFNNKSLKPNDDKVLFLKPGKSWTRSLSILNNIHNEKDIESLSLGKGKKWRQSVRSVLSMQPQGLISSCIKNDENYDKSFYKVSQSMNPKILSSTSHPISPERFIRRMSIRVVPNVNINKIENEIIQDTSFLEVYGINNLLQDKNLSQNTSLLKEPKKSLRYNLRCSNMPDTIISNPVVSAKSVVFERCNQKDSIPFKKCYPDSYLKHCRKIGEGVYGEVFLYEHQKQKSVIKIIPIEGDELVNGEPQKKFDEILSEIIIAKELHNLRFNETFRTSGFVEVKNIRCIIGKYPQKLLNLWQIYDDEKNSENDCPSMFGEYQLYIVLELGHGGENMETFQFHNATEAYATFLQTALTLAVGEKSLDFEHRDMHWGNILISRTKDKEILYKLGDEEITVTCNGLKVTIIDFTLSRMSYQGCCIFNDLALDPALFNAVGEYQFEIYRLMRAKCGNNWQLFEPYTNILWLHYTLDKMIKEVGYNQKTTKIHKTKIKKLQELKDIILNYDSAFDFISNCNKLSNFSRNPSGS